MRNLITRLRRDETGNHAVELVYLIPVFILIIGFLIASARIALAGNAAQAAANSAAREASLARTSTEAQTNANEIAQLAMAQSGYACSQLSVAIDGSGIDVPLGEVGTVRADLSCDITMGDLGIPLPSVITLSANALSAVDPYRERRE